ncbi:MAG: ribosome silencing factor [Syntrophales bacterium]|nr:ribosome silencing factor [Syntrophales bacterium]
MTFTARRSHVGKTYRDSEQKTTAYTVPGNNSRGGVIIKGISLDSQRLVIHCVNATLDRKAEDIVILSVKDISSFADYFVICSGNSDRQIQSLADHVGQKLKTVGVFPLGVEGEHSGSWILMDYGDVILHIFYKPVREFYDIEALWSDAPRMTVEESVQELTVLNDDM